MADEPVAESERPRRVAEAAANAADIALMQRIADRDPAALGELYDRHSEIVFGICLRMLGQRDDAEDILLEVFEELWARAGRYDATRANPLTYVLTLTRSRAIDRLRQRRKTRPISLSANRSDELGIDPADPSAVAPGPMELTEQQRVLNEALGTLQPAQREAIEQSFFAGMSHSEIAEKSQRPLGTVKTNIRMGLIRLRNWLRKTGEDGL